MSMTSRIFVVMTILLAAAPASTAAQRPAGGRAAEATAPQAAVDEQTARETRDRLVQILHQYPPSVGQVLRLDPSLLSKSDYPAPYPTLAAYLGQHPEVAHNPAFFLGGPGVDRLIDVRERQTGAVESIFIGLEFL